MGKTTAMKKTLFLVLLLFVLGLCGFWVFTQAGKGGSNKTVGQSGGESTSDVVRLAIWAGYVSTNVLAKFEESTGVKVEVIEYEEFDEIEPLLVEQGDEFDLVVADNSSMSGFRDKKLIRRFDQKSLLPNLKDVAGYFMGYAEDAENEYLVPYSWGVTLIAYNNTLIKDEPRTWQDFVACDLPIGIIDDEADYHAIGCFLADVDPVSDEDAALEAGEKRFLRLLKDKKNIRFGKSFDLLELLEAGEIAMCTAFSPDAVGWAESSGTPVRWYIPQREKGKCPAVMFYVDNLMLTKQGINSVNAHKLVNFLCDPAVARRNSKGKDVGYNPVAMKAMDVDVAIPFDPENFTPYQEVSDEREAVYDRIYDAITDYKNPKDSSK